MNIKPSDIVLMKNGQRVQVRVVDGRFAAVRPVEVLWVALADLTKEAEEVPA